MHFLLPFLQGDNLLKESPLKLANDLVLRDFFTPVTSQSQSVTYNLYFSHTSGSVSIVILNVHFAIDKVGEHNAPKKGI